MNAITAAQEILPNWVVWGNAILYPALAFLLTLAAASLAVLLASFSRRRMMAASTWTEQARLTYPARVAVRSVALIAPLCCCGFAQVYSGPLNRVPFSCLAFLSGVSAYVAGTFVRWRLARRFGIGKTALPQWLRGVLGDTLLLYPHFLVLFLLFAFLPNRIDSLFVTLLVLGLVLMGFFAWGGGLSLARAVRLAQPIDGQLRVVVDRASARAGVQPRGCYLVASTIANAAAFPLSKRLAFTESVVTVLNEKELDAVCAHELAHLREPMPVALGRVAPLPLLVAVGAVRVVLAVGGVAALSALMLLFFLVVILLQRLSRRMEAGADRIAAGHESEAGVYARALEKIYEANVIPAVLSGRISTHHHLYDRLISAGIQPSYERPRPPSRRRTITALTLSFLLIWFGLNLFPVTRRLVVRKGASAALFSLALGGESEALSILAYQHYRQGDKAGAATLYRAQGELEPFAPAGPANLAITLASMDRCEEAEAAAEEAEARSHGKEDSARQRQLLETVRRAILSCRMRRRMDRDAVPSGQDVGNQ